MSNSTHNDAQPRGRFAHGLGEVDLYLWDSYPQGFNCRSPGTWPEVSTTSLEAAHQVSSLRLFDAYPIDNAYRVSFRT